MSKPRVYVETTIPSFYHDVRTTPEIVARRIWTRRSWVSAADQYELLMSATAIAELERGPAEHHADWLELIAGLPLLEMTSAVIDIVQKYIQHRLMPVATGGDILYLALACSTNAIP